MAEDAFNHTVRCPSCIVVVEGSEHDIGIDPVNERHLSGRHTGTVDGESPNTHVPARDRVQRSLTENNCACVLRAVVEQKPTHVH